MSAPYDQVRYEAAVVAVREVARDVREVGENNRGPRIDVYKLRAHSPLSSHHEWCGFFVYYCLSEAANKYAMPLPFIPEKLWSGSRLAKWAFETPDVRQAWGPWLPGDVYVMNNGHIGIIISHSGGDVVHTVDGNQSSVGKGASLKQRTRNVGDMQVIIRI